MSDPLPQIIELGNGVYRVAQGDRSQLAWAAGPASARWVFFDGRVFLVAPDASSERATARGLHDDMALASPMPATVASVRVAAGQSVARGDVLVMLEAMKMELPIIAPRGGRVRSIACTVGELVQPGVALVELE